MFENARLKLTTWYLVIIMAISFLFSLVIYSGVNNELRRFEQIRVRVQEDIQEGRITPPNQNRTQRFGKPDPEELEAARTRLILTLGFINLAILGFAGAAGYFLAGRTLEPIQKMVDEQKRFITDASHELRTPLTSLRSEVEVGLRNKKLSGTEAIKLLKSNLVEVINLQTLSDSLLELAQNGKLVDKKNLKEVSVSKFMKAAIKKTESLARKKQVTVENKITDGIILGIEDRLTEAFVIFLDNAIKYSPSKSKVNVVSQKEKNKMRVSVTNMGEGINKKDIDHIFDRFYRSDKSRSKTSGYGLGLSIAKKIIESHSGTIIVKSVLNKETVFSVLLPLA